MACVSALTQTLYFEISLKFVKQRVSVKKRKDLKKISHNIGLYYLIISSF